MPRLRVLIREMPPLLRDLVEDAVSTQQDMELLPDRRPTWPRVHAFDGPHVIVTAASDLEQSATAATEWLRWVPTARVVVIDTSGARSMLYELRPHAVPLGELSREQLVHVIRAGVCT